MGDATYQDFRTLRLKFSADCEHSHQVFFKPHNVRVEEPMKPRDRTLFCANIPPWATSDCLARIFRRCGAVEATHLQLQPSVGPPPLPPTTSLFPDPSSPYNLGTGFKFAYVVFASPAGLRHAMGKLEVGEVMVASTKEHPITLGVRRWAQEYNDQFVKEEELMEEVTRYMGEHDKKVAEDKAAEEQLGEPDEEGWVTVTKQDKKKPEKAKKLDEEKKEKGRGKKNRRKKKKVELKNFYSHQVKEDKMTNIRALREKFEEDKMKIAKMKQDRKFRPF